MNKILTNNNDELYNKCDLIYYEEGKKIGWKDGFRAIWCILKYNL